MDLKQFCKDNNIPLEKVGDIGEVSDGFHTFNSLYHQRLILFAALVMAFPDKAWKSHKHHDGKVPFGGGWFIVGLNTPEGQYTYHYEDKDWGLFQCQEIEKAPEWDGHTDKDVTRLLSLFKPEPGTQSDWAEREVALAIAAQKKMTEDTDDWAYMVSCYESALRAHQCLSRDGHFGYSIQITKGILNRLIDGKCLTPIEDTPDIWSDISAEFSKEDKNKRYQCKRMSSLFKTVAPDGTVTLSDTNRVYCVNVDAPDVTFTNGFATRLIDKIFPITMPYFPPSKKFKIVQDEFLVDPEKGDYDTVGYLCIVTPDGKKVELNRYFKEVDGKMVQIEKAEFDDRKAKKVEKKVMEYKGQKMSMAEYTEKILGVKLYPAQKQFLQKLEKLPPNSKLISTPRGWWLSEKAP